MAVKQKYIDLLLNIPGFSVMMVGTLEDPDGDKSLMMDLIRNDHTYHCRCGREFEVLYDSDERCVRDLNYGPWRHCYLVFQQVRVDCPECGVVTEELDWVGPRVSYTKRFAAAVALSCAELRSLSSVAKEYDIHRHTVKQIDKAALEKELVDVSDTAPRLIGVDEAAIKRRHRYATVVVDLDEKSVPYLAKGRTKESLSGYYEALGPDKCGNIKAVAMDMWKPYEEVTRQYCPNAEIVFDPFHIISAYGREVVDKVRIKEARNASMHDGFFIKGCKYLLLKNKQNLDRSKHEPAKLSELLRINKRLFKVYILKDDLKQLWRYRSVAWAKKCFEDWYRRAMYSKIEPLKKFARGLKKRLAGILAHCKYPIHTSIIEGINNKIKVIKRIAFGFMDTEYFFMKIRGAFMDREIHT
ncbi:MAG: ISL3 family transposase [Deltaproteobacteria bacterium]|nr:ISL3 family transposase [Deltaproteobacteria bacterium]